MSTVDNLKNSIQDKLNKNIEAANKTAKNTEAALIDTELKNSQSSESLGDSVSAKLKATLTPYGKYYKRAPEESSTSKYIQANKNTKEGGFKANSSVLKDTPSDKIIIPQLKVDTQKTFSFGGGGGGIGGIISSILGALGLGSVTSLMPTTNTKKIEEPKPTDEKAEYGKIQVKENKAGFVVINDETPGNVRQIDLHPTGTYTAFLDNGDFHTKITNDRQEITDGNWNIKTDKDKIEIVAGNSRIEIRKDVQENITGDRDTNQDGIQNTLIKGNVKEDFKSNYFGKIGEDYNEDVGGNKNEKTSGNLTENITGDHKENTQGALTIKVTGNINITSCGTTTIMSASDISIISGTKITLSAPIIKIG